ncbi:MAG: acyltransferase family protein [Polyangiales bacterium]
MKPQSTNLDLLRSVAVLCVVNSHLWDVLGLTDSGWGHRWGILAVGRLGVLMFFIHTSLVLMLSLERLHDDGSGRVALRFYLRRAFRIYPLSILTVLFVVGLHLPSYFEDHPAPVDTHVLVANLLLVQNIPNWNSVNGPLWSLPFEVQMYLLLPFLYMVGRRIRSQAAAVAFILSAFVMTLLERRLALRVGYGPLLEYAPWFAMGIAAYSIARGARDKLSGRWFCIALFCFVAIDFIIQRLDRGYRGGWYLWADGFAFALLLPHCADISQSVFTRIFHGIAKYSYGIYLSHVPILWFSFKRLNGQPIGVRWAVFVALMTLVPVVLYHVLEEPLIQLGARLAGLSVPARATTRPS